MSNKFWTELNQLVYAAEKAAGENDTTAYVIAYMTMLQHVERHAPHRESKSNPIARAKN